MEEQVKPGRNCWTLVYRMGVGVRVRTFIYTPNFAAPLDTDEAVGALFDGARAARGFTWSPLKHFRPTEVNCAPTVALLERIGGVQ
jgi:hypothetical protein